MITLPSRPASQGRALLAVAALAALLFAGSSVGAAASAAPLSHATVSSGAKVKCVKTSTGFARYSATGSCKKGERKDKKPCAKGGSCVVGDIGPGRGKVFYAARTKQPWGRYLEAALGSWNGPQDDPNVAWCQVVDASIPGTQATGLGAGAANTAAMLTACSSGAANAVHAYTGGGKTDWYLPSRDELRQLFLRQKSVGDFILHGYWSSSEQDVNMAWIQDFYSDYTPAPADKSFASYVRPIRAF